MVKTAMAGRLKETKWFIFHCANKIFTKWSMNIFEEKNNQLERTSDKIFLRSTAVRSRFCSSLVVPNRGFADP